MSEPYWVPLGATSVPTSAAYGTSLPPTPVDGQEFTLVDSITNPSYQWKFRYNAGSSSSFKWEFIGGAPLFGEVLANATTASATYVALAGGPALVLPVGGDYLVGVGARQAHTATADAYMSYDVGATAALDVDAATWRAGGGAGFTGMTMTRKVGLAAVTLTAKYRTSLATASFQSRWLSALPVRVG